MTEMIVVRDDLCIKARVLWAGTDLCVVVTGGSEPHIGSVSVAVPRESLRANGETSSTVSTFNYTAHMDDAVGNHFAHNLSAALYCRVVVTCGIHVDHTDSETIKMINEMSALLLGKLIKKVCSEKQIGQQR